jgi:hypothetical protein
MDHPTSPHELVAVLRRLAAREPSDAQELNTLADECTSLMRHISAMPSLANRIPESVWHFLSDADILFKDSRYAKTQLSGLMSSLAQYDRQNAG